MMCRPYLFAVCALLVASAAHAKIDGHPESTGRVGRCSDCHGEKGYADGVQFALPAATECWVANEAGTLEKSSIWLAKPGETVDLKITVNEPPAAPECPTAAACCLATAEVPCASGSPDALTCSFVNRPCGDTIVGFGAEAYPVGSFTKADESTRVPGDVEGGTPDFSQIVHAAPKTFTGGKAEWTVKLTIPTVEELVDDVYTPDVDEKALGAFNLYIGGNAANGNGLADTEDLNVNIRDVVYVGETLPATCAVCEGGVAINADGTCPGCACTALPTRPGVAGLAVFGALAVMLRRRRR